jgi:hypothetical protein
MTSERKIAANWRNSRQEQWTRSIKGKKRIRRNAPRHRLSAVTLSAPAALG